MGAFSPRCEPHVALSGRLFSPLCLFRDVFTNCMCRTDIDKYTGKLDHSPLVVVEAELGQVWPFCCWYSTTMLIHRK